MTDHKKDNAERNKATKVELKRLGEQLRKEFQALVDEPLPDDIQKLLDKLEEISEN